MADQKTNIITAADRLGISTCNVQEAKDFVKLCIKVGDVPCLVGSTGIGKTQLMRQVAQEMDATLLPLFLAHREREDVIGIPFPSDDTPTYKFLVEEAIYKILDHEKPVIIHLDEFNRADTPVLNAAFTMIEDRVYGSLKLPNNVGIACCMNPSEEGYIVNGCENDPAFRRRLCFVNVVANHLTWIEYATNEGDYDEDVVSFIRAKPVYLDSPDARLASKVGPNPAAWEKVSNTVKTLKEENGSFANATTVPGLRIKIAGHVGVPAMVQFMEYATRTDTDRIYPEDLLEVDNKGSLNKLKTTVTDNKNDIVAETLKSLAVLIVTKTPDPEKLADQLAKIYGIVPPDLIRAFSQDIRTQGMAIGKLAYVQDISKAVSAHKGCRAAMQVLFDATENIRSEIANSI